jgi:outer membrane protein W
MIPFRAIILCRVIPALAATAISTSALACASCGCTLSSDWESQGFTTHPGLKVDIRYDYLNQNQLRHDTGTVSAANASQMVTSTGDPQEVEKYTRNNYVTLGLDYTFNADWGINVQLPYINRSHGTLGVNSNGSDPADGAYDSNTSGLGDAKVIGRYQGFTPQHNLGIMFGFKLPTGSHTQTGTSTDPANPGDATPIDRGLQPGTGTTDGILGAYYFGTLNKNWDYFVQATVQMALNSKDDYKPGTGYNLNVGVRYMAFGDVIPQIQLNTRYVKHDTGANADQTSTGGTLMYLSPGLVVPVTKQVSVYGFVQLPIYQDVRGVQLTPRYTASIGARFAF